ncbi:PAS domain-containing sensor histidine kinase [Mucilaginibacter sp. AK015]|uniref:sensor histidine kinase n=1 Tax=Mucilaginibacter sp. AK015 TaxID=2723072 RepID=UPI00161BFD44|nr:ATP-binding protein [Mucilaginibacter sp. AK015]MBB5394366.1 nitrogen fixation/metabolism regulation signal transduction histidine kinase [Mucilaginibacter sp. AK015]
MKLRTKYILFVTILHLLTLGLTFYIFDKDRVFFIISEVFIIVSLVIAVNLYGQLIRPIKMLLQGIEALKDRDFNVKFLPTGKHEVDQLINVYNQMIDELRTERTQQEEQHFFLEKLIYTSPTGIIILDHDERIQQLNPKALAILGLDEKELIGNNINELQHPLFKQAKLLKAGETITAKLSGVTTYKLQKSHFIDRGFQRNFIMMEELTAEILAAEKNTYGKVIRMMAHEVNNTIGPVNSIIQSALKSGELWQHEPDSQLNNALQVAFDRNQNLNHFMRNFADLVKLPDANKKQTDLNHLLNSVIELMQIKAHERQISLVYHPTEQPLIIMADVQQMEQALINIVKNAIEAIENDGVVTFTVDARGRKLTITDTGKGISNEQSTQLFTPFYSTKRDGQGIGLTLVREIMLNHGFKFSLKTIAEGHTDFTIHF